MTRSWKIKKRSWLLYALFAQIACPVISYLWVPEAWQESWRTGRIWWELGIAEILFLIFSYPCFVEGFGWHQGQEVKK